MNQPKVKIGFEIHVQLKTKSKLFCDCPSSFLDAEPNTNICPVCTAQPGAKPFGLNKKALENLLRLGLMLNCKINKDLVYIQRKHYFYPDLPNNYQRTSQPIAVNGKLMDVNIWEIHIEEDPGRYELRQGTVDFNRSGVPLAEIVTAPDMKSPEEARKFLKKLQMLLRYLGVAREEAGTTRIDANISINGGNRAEIKNINSFYGVYHALKFEIMRQSNLVKQGKKIKMETRHYDENQMITLSLREKETVADYRYMPDPDLPPLFIDKKWIQNLKKTLPIPPWERAKIIKKKYRLNDELVDILVGEKELVDLFEALAKKIDPELAAEFICGELKRVLNYNNIEYRDSGLTQTQIIELLTMLKNREITDVVLHKLIEQLIIEPQSPRKLVKTLGLERIADDSKLEKFAEEAIKENPQAVEDFRKGKPESINFLVGQVMRKTKGKADPKTIGKILKKKIK
jgi:aspartyl-tRNA(Asn)/glutamyl-tRNA(Gln) amidotransferase subunit B